MNKQEYLTRIKCYYKEVRTTTNRQRRKELLRAISNLKANLNIKGKVICRPIKKNKIQEKKPKNCIKACCNSQGIESYPFTSKVFDYIKAK